MSLLLNISFLNLKVTLRTFRQNFQIAFRSKVQNNLLTNLKVKISPHYRSEGRRQVSGGVFGGSMALSEDYRDKCHKI